MLRVLGVLLLLWYGCVHLVRLLGLRAHWMRLREIPLWEKNHLVATGSPAAGRANGVRNTTGVTIIRPMKGSDESLYDCLRSAFQQKYSGDFEVLLCADSDQDPAVLTARRLLAEFPHIHGQLLIGNETFGPNPKINNLVKAYRAACHDIIWVLDANVWVGPQTLERAITEFHRSPRVSLVHHLPLATNYTGQEGLLAGQGNLDGLNSILHRLIGSLGGRLDEMYMATAHSLFYTGINEVSIAPCIMGKSNLYRRSQLDAATAGQGLAHFAKYMAEDHMIAEALWAYGGRTSMAVDAAIQPLGHGVSIRAFTDRRVRWVRLRKYMVTAATLVEPSTDALFGCFIGSLGLKLLLATSFWPLWFICVAGWAAVDRYNFMLLQRYIRPDLVREHPIGSWIVIWLLRETLALPLWIWAMAGRRIEWRGKPFRIRPDLVAEEVSL